MRGTTITATEAVAIALGQIDKLVNDGLSPTEAIFRVAADNDVAYDKLEHFYIERGRNGNS